MTKPSALEGLEIAFQSFQNALLSNDGRALDRLLASDYHGVTIYGHPEGRSTVIDMFGSGEVTMDVFEVEDTAIEVCDHIGVIAGKGYISGRYAGEFWQHHVRFCDVYVLRDGRWQLQLSQSTEIQPIE